MRTFERNDETDETNEGAGELRILCRDGRWRPLVASVALPVAEAVEIPGDVILQLVSRAKTGPTTLETILDAVRRQWNSAA